MSGDVRLIVERRARIYDQGPLHPLRPDRVLLTWDLIEALGLDRTPNVQVTGAEPASIDDLTRVHTDAFIDATTRAGHGEDGDWARFGYGPGDNPIFADMHEAGAIVSGASIAAAAAVWSGGAAHAFNAAGGLHHAMPERASGFCVYDDPAVAIAWLLAARRQTRRLRRRRRAPRRWTAGDLLGRPPGADRLVARVRAAVLLPGDRRHAGARWAGRARWSRERAAAPRHGRRRLARRAAHDRAARRRRVRARRARDAARLRHASHRSAGASCD